MKPEENTKDKQFASDMREFFNRKAQHTTQGDYEYYRWFSTPRKRLQYYYTTESISYHLRDISVKRCLEVGCGPGTWTRLLLTRYPKADIVCIDISKEMILQLGNNIPSKRVKTIVNNFLDQTFNERFDFIFCSRAIEYIPNKQKVIEKFYSLLKLEGKGIIISSPPHKIFFLLKHTIGKKIDPEHSQRISVKDLTQLLKKAGFTNVTSYPILFTDSLVIPNNFLFKRFYKKPWGVVARLFASGYITKFEKKRV